MKRSMYVMVAWLLVTGTARAEWPDDQKGKGHSKSEQLVPYNRDSDVEIHVVFSQHEAQVIHNYYAPRYRKLPPGLQKKLRRTGQLPPGWQKKLQPFPPVVEHELVVLPNGYGRGVIDGHAVIYSQKTQRIVDVKVLF